MIEIKNLRKHQPKEVYDFRVDRLSIFGNPYEMKKENQRDEVCDKYEQYFNDNKDSYFKKDLQRILRSYKEHGKLRLFCWCAPKRCHAETIKKWIEENI